jgi:5-hydroxyisourate hydrolase-like protein (transthyretin family)
MPGKFILASVMALLALVPGNAQFKERDVTGIVTDARGNPLPKVAVELENTGNLIVRSYITNKDGRYYFAGLIDNVDFTLKAQYRNYWSKPKTLSKFDSSAHPEVNLVIPVD